MSAGQPQNGASASRCRIESSERFSGQPPPPLTDDQARLPCVYLRHFPNNSSPPTCSGISSAIVQTDAVNPARI